MSETRRINPFWISWSGNKFNLTFKEPFDTIDSFNDAQLLLQIVGLELTEAKLLREAARDERIQAAHEMDLAQEQEYHSRIHCAEQDLQARLSNLE